MVLYKFLRTGLKSDHSRVTWKIDEWKHIEGELEMCKNGFHCSRTPYDAFKYVHGSILAEVEIDTDFIEEEDKLCSKSMKIVKAWKFSKKDSVELSIFAAQSVLDIYENKYPNDIRPRKAIEAAQAWLDAGDAAGDAAGAASYAAYAAAYAAGDASYAAYAAGDAAYAAYAAYAAGDAAYAAYAAAAYTAGDAAVAYAAADAAGAGDAAGTGDSHIKKILNDWIINRIPQLEEITGED